MADMLNWWEREKRCRARESLEDFLEGQWYLILQYTAPPPVICMACEDRVSCYGAAVWRLVNGPERAIGTVMHYWCGRLLQQRQPCIELMEVP